MVVVTGRGRLHRFRRRPFVAASLVFATLGGVVGVERRTEQKPRAAVPESIVLYVSPDGSDQWSGRRREPNAQKTDGPFQTLSRAIEEWRLFKKSGSEIGVTIIVRPGIHRLTEPLILGPDDSGTERGPLTVVAEVRGSAIISGGILITDWEKASGPFWSAKGPKRDQLPHPIRILEVGGRWATVARYPDADPSDPIKRGWLFAQWWGEPWQRGAFNSGVGNIHNKGDLLEWRVKVPAPGDYYIWIRYAHNMKSYGVSDMSGRTTFSVVGGEKVILTNLPDTGGWDRFTWSRSGVIRLNAGEQILIWQNEQGGGINLDAFCLTDESDWNPETAITVVGWWGQYEVTPPTGHLLIVQAEACDRAVGKEITVERPPLPGTMNKIAVAPEKFPNWHDWSGALVSIFPAWGWVNAIAEVKKADAEKKTLVVKCDQDIRPGNRFFIFNAREALDCPGEWYWDPESGDITYYPVEKSFPDVPVYAPILDRLVHIKGDPARDRWVEHIYLEGLTFRHTTYTAPGGYYDPADAAIWLSGARSCVVADCTFERLGGYAVRLDDQSQGNKIVRNKMIALGQGGVILMGDTQSQPRNNLIGGNEMSDLGQIYKHVAGVYVISGSGNRIANNRMERVPRYGISLKSLDSHFYSHNNLVELNQLIDTNLETNDTGAIETLGRDQQDSGNVIRWNYIRNVVGLGTTSEGSLLSPYFTWGIYLDDYSSGTLVYGNVVIGTVLGAVCIHGGRNNIIENNIFIDGSERQFTFQPRDEFMVGNVIRRNIFYYRKAATALFYSWAATWSSDRLKECDDNLYWCQEKKIDEIGGPLTPEGDFSSWRRAGWDQRSVIADPLFVNPQAGDFRLRSESPAFQIGFQPIPWERMGPEGFREEEE